MERRKYIYSAIPLFVLLSCGQGMEALLGSLGALIVGSIAVLAAWGVMWMRLYGKGMRPEYAVLSILPHSIYFISRYVDAQCFEQSPACQNLYALTWLGFAGVSIASVKEPHLAATKDPVFLLLIPLILFYSFSTFSQYYTALSNIHSAL